jgi:hypothetical protein
VPEPTAPLAPSSMYNSFKIGAVNDMHIDKKILIIKYVIENFIDEDNNKKDNISEMYT